MLLDDIKPSPTRTVLLAVIGCLHLLFIVLMLQHTSTNSESTPARTSKLVLVVSTYTPIKHGPVTTGKTTDLALSNQIKGIAQKVPATRPAPNTTSQDKINSVAAVQTDIIDAGENHNINRDVKKLTKDLEREWGQEERKQQAAKPPNQLVREYWEKQNHPYQDKWDALANKIEKAGIARGPQEESYTLDDGSRITKINGVCYKAPDPGRTYLAQPEVRRVFCPRN